MKLAILAADPGKQLSGDPFCLIFGNVPWKVSVMDARSLVSVL